MGWHFHFGTVPLCNRGGANPTVSIFVIISDKQLPMFILGIFEDFAMKED